MITDKKQGFTPTLLERLLDYEPKKQHESYDAVYIDARQMRALVQKDIACLLNSANLEELLDEDKHGLVMASVINYGVAPLVGKYSHHHNWSIIEKNIRNALLRFEPRIIPETLLVRPWPDKEHAGKNSQILFEIRGLIRWQPHPIDLSLNGSYDAETAKVALKSD
ncbi:type VI secretion system baseplate subunit TssE [Erwinia phyllosphaerae]|uniref:type VI secretion system baseplate subunit TssE n=1 Tax=Erwinia phyllosphaerae TaxID=2853256 RepID=UPI001FEE8ACB|nr:GPW/gp25 family protein [Erwinia phyllosphaerae]MBV4367398.1 GPW/gp25 family protein [Erwinia phyllosphaerae]